MSQHKDRSDLKYAETAGGRIDVCPWHSTLDLVEVMSLGPRDGETHADFLSRVANLFVERSGIDRVAVYGRSQERDDFVLLAAAGDDGEEIDGNGWPTAALMSAAVDGTGLFWRRGDAIETAAATVPPTPLETAMTPPDGPWRSFAVQPILLDHTPVGAMSIASAEHDVSDEETRRLVRIAARLLTSVVADAGGARGAADGRVHDGVASASQPDQGRVVVDGVVDWIWESDDSLIYVYVSGDIEEASGMSPGDLVGRRIDEVAKIAGDADNWHEHINAIRDHRPFRDFVYDLETADGRVRRFRANGRPIFDARGRFQGYRGAAVDITAQMLAEGRARAAERRLHAALEQLPAGFALFDAADRMVMCNGKYREFYDMDPDVVAAHKTFEELLRDAVARRVYGGDLAGDTSSSKAVAKGFEARLKAHRSASGQFDARLADGRWISIRERPLPDGGIVAVHADVTETKLVSQELERKSDLLQTTLDHMTQGISVFDADLKLVVFNRRFHELLDFPEELGKPGTSFEEIIRFNAERGEYGPGDVEEQVRTRVDLARQFKAHRFERVRPDNRVIEIRGAPLPDGGFVSTYTDITERKHAEWQAKRAQERLMDAIEASADGFVLFDSDDRLVLCNSRMRELYAGVADLLVPGVAASEVLFAMVRRGVYAQAKGHEAEWIDRLLRQRGELSGARELLIEDGRWVRETDRRTRDAGVVGIRTDITELKRREQALISAKEAAEFANRSKDEFLANVSHELRTPLNAVIGFSEVLAAEMFGPLGADVYRDYAAHIHESGRHLLALINDILDLSKIEAGKLELHEERVSIRQAVETSLTLVAERARQGQVELSSAVPDDLPDFMGDSTRVKQVLLNLLSNAVKFTPAEGRVEIAAMLEDSGELVISVSDNGIGMDGDDIPLALSAFGQVGSAFTRRFEGTGLGLPLANSLVAAHGGRLAIKSKPGEGTTATVYLPAARLCT